MALKNEIEDWNYLKKQLFQNYGILPDDVDKQNYVNLLETLKARPKDERPMDAAEAQKKLQSLFS